MQQGAAKLGCISSERMGCFLQGANRHHRHVHLGVAASSSRVQHRHFEVGAPPPVVDQFRRCFAGLCHMHGALCYFACVPLSWRDYAIIQV